MEPHPQGRLHFYPIIERLVFLQLHCHSIEGEVQALLGEGLVDSLVHVKIDCPIIGSVAPHTHCNIYSASTQRAKLNERSGSLCNALVLADNIEKHTLCKLIVVAIRD